MRKIQRELERRTQKDIAEAVGIEKSYLCHLLHGRRQPSVPLARRLAKELGVTVGELLDYLEPLEVAA